MCIVEISSDPERRAFIAELGQILEEAVLGLPDQYRTVVMLRDVEEMTTSETAAALDLTDQNVKVRLHRGRAMMRDWLFARVGEMAKERFHLWPSAVTVSSSGCLPDLWKRIQQSSGFPEAD